MGEAQSGWSQSWTLFGIGELCGGSGMSKAVAQVVTRAMGELCLALDELGPSSLSKTFDHVRTRLVLATSERVARKALMRLLV